MNIEIDTDELHTIIQGLDVCISVMYKENIPHQSTVKRFQKIQSKLVNQLLDKEAE